MDAPDHIDAATTLRQGREALRRGVWEEARAHFEAALRHEESPEAWEGLATACWWLHDHVHLVHARQCAYRLHRARGDDRAAAFTAASLAADVQAEPAIASGWLERARRLLAGQEPCHELGWLRAVESHLALMVHNDPHAALAHALECVRIAQAAGDPDIEMLGRALEGLSLVSVGRIQEGMLRLDEAITAAVNGELSDPKAVANSCCYLIHACERVRDFDRALQWCEHMRDYCTRWRIGPMLTVCRIQYGTVLLWRGEWEAAEAEFRQAEHDLVAARRGEPIAVFVRLAELRRRQGRFDEAERLLEQARPHRLAPLWSAALALDQQDPARARDSAELFLRGIPAALPTERLAGLELLVRAHAALRELDEARAALLEVERTAGLVDTDPVTATASSCRGLLAAASGDHERARAHFEDAAALFERCGIPFEAGRARLELARSLVALSRPGAARLEAERALATFRQLGAAAEASGAALLLERLAEASPDAGSARLARGGLTPRQLEVLQLIAEGLSDRQIADRLFLSEFTVHRHVANILTRLEVSSRTAAVAHAVREGWWG